MVSQFVNLREEINSTKFEVQGIFKKSHVQLHIRFQWHLSRRGHNFYGYMENWRKLQLTAVKLKSLAQLIENQNAELTCLDQDDYWGLALQLQGISEEIRAVSAKLEKKELGQL